MSCPVIELAQQLIRRPSLSPDDAGCQALMIERLRAIGFTVEPMDFGDTQNFWAWRGHGETLAFAGHTDVVPAGDADRWINPPFEPTIRDGMLFGRGAADMKGSLAAMIVAVEEYVKTNPNHQGSIAFLITSDEEAAAKDGTVRVVETLMARGEKVDFCMVGEPSSAVKLGDTIKNGRRGSITANLYIQGIQGHVAYPHLADNPVHKALPMLDELVKFEWDQGNDFFPPTTLQIANIQAGTGSNNVIPGELYVQFNLRFSPEVSEQSIRRTVVELLEKHQCQYRIEWNLSGLPFVTKQGEFIQAVSSAVRQHLGTSPKLDTGGGTSDGRFIAQMGTQVVELGPLNATIHKVDECVSCDDLYRLALVHRQLLQNLLG